MSCSPAQEDREIGPKIQDYQAGYNWVHDVVIKKKKQDDAASYYQQAMDSTAELQRQAATEVHRDIDDATKEELERKLVR